MVKLHKMSPEVLIYIQSIKKYFSSHSDAQEYFKVEGNEEAFFEQMGEMSQKNFEEHGEPQLTLDQFEEIRYAITKFVGKRDEITGVFISLGNLGYVSLN